MAGLALQGLKLGSEHLPDRAFEKIPFAGPKYFKEDQDNKNQQDAQNKKRGSRGQRDRYADGGSRRGYAPSDTDPYDTNPESEYERERERERERRARRSHRRTAREEQRRHDRGYDSNPESPAISRGQNDRARGQDSGSRQYNEAPRNDEYPYFPPPPKFAAEEAGVPDGSAYDQGYPQEPYNPADYNTSERHRDGYAPSEANYPPPPGPPPSQKPRARFDDNSTRGAPSGAPSSTHSSAADRYRPRNADPYTPPSPNRYNDRGMSPTTRSATGRDSPRPAYPSALAVRPPSDYYASQESLHSPGYDSRYDEDDDNDSRRRHGRHASKQRRSGSRSSSRFGEARDKAREGFKQHKEEIGAGALGALAGALLGREFGGSKKGNLGMVVGAALGGVGAGLYGKRQEKQPHPVTGMAREKEREWERERSESRRGRSRPRREYAGYESY